jgi:hypothetical protein
MATIVLSYEQKESIVQDVLMNDFESVCRDIAKLSARDDLKEFEQEDLEDLKKNRKAMKRLLRYYMVRVHADEFIDDVETYFKVINDFEVISDV